MQNNLSTFNKKKSSHTLLLLLLILLIAAAFFNQFVLAINYIFVAVIALWFPFLFKNYNNLSRQGSILVLVSMGYLLYISIYLFIGYSDDGFQYLRRNGIWLAAGVMAVYVLEFFSKKELSSLFFVLSIIIVALAVALILFGQSLSKYGEDSEAASAARAWIGSMYMIIGGIALIFILHVKSVLPRLVAIFILLLSLYLNFNILQRGTVVIFTIVEMALILVLSFKNKLVVWALSLTIIVLGFYAFFSGMYLDLFYKLADSVPSERLADRFRSIAIALQYEDIEAGGSSLSARNRLIDNSWHTFTSSIRNFIFGAGAHRGDNSIIGNHSFIIDTFASYGIIGGFLIFVYLKKQYQLVMSKLNYKSTPVLYLQFMVVFAFYILRNFYGVMATAAINFVLLIYFPLTIDYILNSNLNHSQEIT